MIPRWRDVATVAGLYALLLPAAFAFGYVVAAAVGYVLGKNPF
jgi:hypothetical protein